MQVPGKCLFRIDLLQGLKPPEGIILSGIFHESEEDTMMRLEYGDALMIYCIGSVDRTDTVERFRAIIPHVGNEDISAQMFALKEKINDLDDEDWAVFFPKILRNMAVYLDHDRENFQKALEEVHTELDADHVKGLSRNNVDFGTF